jgi:hypothetical protein
MTGFELKILGQIYTKSIKSRPNIKNKGKHSLKKIDCFIWI